MMVKKNTKKKEKAGAEGEEPQAGEAEVGWETKTENKTETKRESKGESKGESNGVKVPKVLELESDDRPFVVEDQVRNRRRRKALESAEAEQAHLVAEAEDRDTANGEEAQEGGGGSGVSFGSGGGGGGDVGFVDPASPDALLVAFAFWDRRDPLGAKEALSFMQVRALHSVTM